MKLFVEKALNHSTFRTFNLVDLAAQVSSSVQKQ
jgi:hypothetical protein